MQQRQPAIGSQWYISPDTSVEDIQQGIAAMAAHGLRLVRIFAIWDHLEPQPGCYDWTRYDALFDAAAAHNLGVIPTLFAVSPPGWMNITNDSQALGPLEDEQYWAAALAHTQIVVEHWRQHPALHSWILWNEPSRVPAQSAAAQQRWQAFLQRRYGTVAALNAQRYRQAPDWSVAASVEGDSGSAFRGFEHACDRLRFAVDELQHWLKDLAETVRRCDPQHPIHVNPHNVGSCVLPAGQSIWREGDLVDFIGVSAHPPWHSTRFPAWRVPHSIEFFADLARSASRHEHRFWISELQGGPTVYSAEHSSGPDADDLRRWLAHGFASGAEAVVFWCFNQRTGGFEVGEWGLMGLDNRPTARLQEVAHTSQWLVQHQDLLTTAQPWPESIAILHSEDSERLQAVVGRGESVHDPRNRHAHWDALAGAWLLCRDAGHEVCIIDEDRWLAGQELPASVQTILVPGASALSSACAQRLAAFAAAGGRVIADGLCGWNDANAHRGDAAAHAGLFGCDLHDLRGLRPGTAPLRMRDTALPACLLQGVLNPVADSCAVLDTWPDGSPAICRNSFGQGKGQGEETGQVYRLATMVFAAYLQAQHQTEATDASAPSSTYAWLRAQLKASQPPPLHLPSQSQSRLWRRCLACDQGCLVLLINYGAAITVPLGMEPGYTPWALKQTGLVELDAQTPLSLAPGASQWLLLRRD